MAKKEFYFVGSIDGNSVLIEKAAYEIKKNIFNCLLHQEFVAEQQYEIIEYLIKKGLIEDN